MADLSGLLNAITAENPCGENLEYDSARVALDTDILGTPENQFTGEKAQPPNWHDIAKQAAGLLQRSKDLQVVLYLVRALIHVEGLSGLRDGLNLLQASLTNYWDTIHPRLDPDDGLDPTLRINILEELSSFDLILKPLSMATLVEAKTVGRFCLRDIQYATDRVEVPHGVTKPDINMVKAAFQEMEIESLRASQQAVFESLACLEEMERFVAEKVGMSQGADWQPIKTLLKEMRFDFEQFAQERLAVQDDAGGGDAADGGAIAGEGVAPARPKAAIDAIRTRQDVIKTLDLLCKYYAENEPSSPVPILLQRAKFLATADFVSIIQNLAPDALNQISAIKGPDTN